MTVYGYGAEAPHDPHTDVGAYVLGVLDDADMFRFEQHLAICHQCGQQLDELSGLVPVLAELAPAGAGAPVLPNGEAMLGRLLDSVSVERGRRRRRRWLALAAAAVLVVGGPTVAVIATQSSGSSSSSPMAMTYTATDATSGVQAKLGMVQKAWGTQVALQLSKVNGPLTCQLVAVGKDGTQQTVSTWNVSSDGYGTKSQPKPLSVEGGAGLSASNIDRFDVVTSTGKKLVSVHV
ncbi:anti-sigma factor family protein [Actinacidiphila oryziradicis]|uniref:Zf-HC2 domain-containing protein n=1 Tax=Actinacidiphila oryziradicis TaxID=2571141 RepID=A0A4U0SLS3_9ACTN|nr:zf-HC2 domain-containing protein [Actinacidiphila oryziradicis]TKA10203.1 zf-HC2 domain-containing protein [Actinacidiphila oryziradicis]